MSLIDVNGNPIEIGGSKTSDSMWNREFHWNLANANDLEVGSLNSSGAEIAGSNSSWNYRRTSYIEVKAGETLHWMWCYVYGYDENKNFVSVLTQSGGIGVVPQNVKYIRATHYKNNKEEIPSINIYARGYGNNTLIYSSTYDHEHGFPMIHDDSDSMKGFRSYVGILPWHDKRILVIGDSFTAPGKWQKEMCDNLGAILDSHAISGGGWCTGRTKTTYQLASEVTNKPDIIIIAHATNDIANNAPIGSFVQGTSESDYDESTFWGAMQKALTYIRNRWSGVPCYVGTTPAAGLTSGTGEEYIDAMKECCIKYGCVYIETRTCGMAYPLVQNDLQYRNSAGDGHPSIEGQHQIARYMTDLMTGYMSVREFI